MKSFQAVSKSVIVFISKEEVLVSVVEPVVVVEFKSGLTPIGYVSKYPKVVSSIPSSSSSIVLYESLNSFLSPSSSAKLAKSTAIELKLSLKTLKGISFSYSFYDINFSFISFKAHKSNVFHMVKGFKGCYQVLVELFVSSWFDFFKCFGFEFSFSSLSVVYSNSDYNIVYSSLSLSFSFLFGSSLSLIFPNSSIDIDISTLGVFDVFSHFNALSFSGLSFTISSILGVHGNLSLSGLYGSKMSKLDYLCSIKCSEGVKLVFHKFYSVSGSSGSCSFSCLYNPNSFSCSSSSFFYQNLPYTKVFSFSTNGSMSKLCKTFNPSKMLAGSSVIKTDKYWTKTKYVKKVEGK